MAQRTRYLLPALVSLGLTLVAWAAVLELRHLGWLEKLELRGYDALLALQSDDGWESPVVIIGIDEADIRAAGHYPPSDRQVANLFERVLMFKPHAIGMDFFRDIHVEFSDEAGGGGPACLENLLIQNTQIVPVMLFGPRETAIGPPRVLCHDERQSTRIGFANFVRDADSVVRRALLSVHNDGNFIPPQDDLFSLSSVLADIYLQKALKPTTMRTDAATGDPLINDDAIRRVRSNDGPYASFDDRGRQYMINYRTARRHRTYSLQQVMSDLSTAQSLSGKIVLIGITAASLKDFFDSPLDQRVPGVEAHAICIDQILRAATLGEKSIRFLPRAADSSWILGWALAGGALGLFAHHPLRLSFYLISLLVVLGFACAFAFSHGTWLPLFPPAIAAAASATLVTSYVLYRERSDRSALMTLFSRHSSPEVATAIWDQREEFLERGRPRSQELVATLLFTDLEGFSSVSENMAPVPLMDWLNQYMEVMSRQVLDNQGVIIKYMGDSIMAVFGAPVPRKSPDQIAQDAARAVRSAIGMRSQLKLLSRQWEAQNLPRVRMRVGIFTGRVVAGSIGGRDRLEYTVTGDTVNTASRLESFDKDQMQHAHDGCRILVGRPAPELADAFAAALAGIDAVSIGTHSFHNKSNRVEIFAVTAGSTVPQPTSVHAQTA